MQASGSAHGPHALPSLFVKIKWGLGPQTPWLAQPGSRRRTLRPVVLIAIGAASGIHGAISEQNIPNSINNSFLLPRISQYVIISITVQAHIG
jgi:hypothetical protein